MGVCIEIITFKGNLLDSACDEILISLVTTVVFDYCQLNTVRYKQIIELDYREDAVDLPLYNSCILYGFGSHN